MQVKLLKVKLLVILGCVGILSGCNALDGKCDYIPPNNCGCSTSPGDPSYYNCNCRQYLNAHQRTDIYHCGSCSCVGDTCSNCWACGKYYNFHDE